MAFACRRSSDLVLGVSSLIACALVMLPLKHDRTGPVLRFQAIVLWNGAFLTCRPSHKFAGLFCVLLVGQFTVGMFGIECFVNGVQGVKPVANHHAVHQRVACGGGESPVQFGYVRVFICLLSLTRMSV